MHDVTSCMTHPIILQDVLDWRHQGSRAPRNRLLLIDALFQQDPKALHERDDWLVRGEAGDDGQVFQGVLSPWYRQNEFSRKRTRLGEVVVPVHQGFRQNKRGRETDTLIIIILK